MWMTQILLVWKQTQMEWESTSELNSLSIKGSCEQVMDECFLLSLFENESLCETFHIKMS